MTNETTVDFRCTETDQERATQPKSAYHEFPRIRENEWMQDTLAVSAWNDEKSRDALKQGWYLYIPESVLIRDTDDGELSIRTSGDLVSELDDTTAVGELRGTIDTLWHVNVPEGHVLLVTAPLYDSDAPPRPFLVTDDDGWSRLRIPVVVHGPRTFHDIEPIAQAMLLSKDLLTTSDYTTGEFDSAGNTRFEQAQQLEAVYEDAYSERIRTLKSPAEIRDADEL